MCLKQKKDELFISRRYNLTPLLRSSPGGLEGACRMTLIRLQKYEHFFKSQNISVNKCYFCSKIFYFGQKIVSLQRKNKEQYECIRPFGQ